MARPQPDCAVELLGGWNPIESLRFVKGHRRSLPGMILAIAFLLLAVVSITSLIAHPAESAQIVLTERSAIQVVDISSGVIKDLFRSHGDVHPICLPGGKGIAFVRFVRSGQKAPMNSSYWIKPRKSQRKLPLEWTLRYASPHRRTASSWLTFLIGQNRFTSSELILLRRHS